MKSLRFSLFVLVLLALCSCSKKDYLKVIPADATVVASVNLRSLAEKSDFANAAIMGMMGGNEGDLQKYKDNPMETGIDFEQPLYVFLTRENLYGIVMKVSDKGDLEEFFSALHKQNVVSRPTEHKGLMCGTMGTINYAFNGEALLLLDGVSGRNASSNLLVKMMDNEGESFADTDAYERMGGADGKDVVVYTNLGYMPAVLQKEFKAYLQYGQLKMSDIEFISSLDFVDGSAIVETKWWGRTEKAQKVIDESKDCWRVIDGSYMNDLPQGALAWIGAGVHGDKFLEKLKGNAQAKEALFLLERGIDVEQIVRSIDGDVSVVIPATALNGTEVDFAGKAKLKSTSFLAEVDDWKSGMAEFGISMRSEGKGAYALSMDGKEIHWGAEGNDLYFATTKAYQQMQSKGGSAVLKDYEDDIKKCLFFVYVDLQEIQRMNNVATLCAMASNFGVNLQGMKAIVLKSSAHDEMVLQIDMKNDNENFLKQLFK